MNGKFPRQRWLAAAAAALLAATWLSCGLITARNGASVVSLAQQRENRELLRPSPSWLSLGEAWALNTAHGRRATVAQAQLVRHAGHPVWLVQDGEGRRVALSALDGQVRRVDADESLDIAARWVARGDDFDELPDDSTLPLVHLGERELPARDGTAPAQRVHRVAVGILGRELLICAATGEVVHDSSRGARVAQWIWSLGGLRGGAWGQEASAGAVPIQASTPRAGTRVAPAALSARPFEAVDAADAESVVELEWRQQGLLALTRPSVRTNSPGA